MTKTTATVLGFAIVPVIPAVFFAVEQRAFDHRYRLLPLSLLLKMDYMLPAVIIVALGFPSLLILRRIGLIRWWSIGLVGFCIGLLFAFCFRTHNSLSAHDVITYGAVGALSSFFLWLSWKLGVEVAPALHD